MKNYIRKEKSQMNKVFMTSQKKIDCPKLNNEELNTLEGPLTDTEVLNFLKKTKNDKSPGPDGFTSEFFKFFWKDLGTFITRAINQSLKIGSFSDINKLGVITCIPKAGKPKQFLKNWRPITLLNVIYKLASGSIAERMKTVLDKLINQSRARCKATSRSSVEAAN